MTNPEPPEVATLDAPAPAPVPDSPAPAQAAAPSPPVPGDRTRRGWRWAVLPALLVALVASLAVAVVQTVRLRDEHELSEARQEAVAAAGNYAVDISTYDFTHLDAQFKKVQDEST